MILVKVLKKINDTDSKELLESEVVINQKQICSFEPAYIPGYTKICTRIKMSNGDVFDAVYPTYEQWQVDAYTTDQNY